MAIYSKSIATEKTKKLMIRKFHNTINRENYFSINSNMKF